LPFSLFPTSINVENIIHIITSLIDIIAIAVIAVTLIQTIIYLLKKNLKSLSLLSSSSSSSSSQSPDNNLKITKRNFVSGLLLALEFEAANAILKMGVFLSQTIDISSTSTATVTATAVTSENLINNFLIYVIILAVRIAINQSLQRFGRRHI
jgi:hypothetical protein